MLVSCDFNKTAICILTVLAVIVAAVFTCADSDIICSAASKGTESACPILVIDPGHGGEDGGAVSKNGTRESTLNMDIALKTAVIADFIGIENELTRESEEIDYPKDISSTAKRKAYDTKRRVSYVNAMESVVLVSIHQNCFPQASPRGPQVFYGTVEGGMELAAIVQNKMNSCLYPENRRVAAPANKDIYLMKNAQCPAILVECGFISNPQDEKLLNTDAYRTKLALIIAGSYLKYCTDNTNEELNES